MCSTRTVALAAILAILGMGLPGCHDISADRDEGFAAPATKGTVRLDLHVIGRYSSGLFGQSAAEIVAFDPSTDQLFVVNAAAVSVDVIDLSDPTTPVLLGTIDARVEGGAANSVAIHDGIAAVAIEAAARTDPGKVVFYDTRTLARIGAATVGALPDMLVFTPDGNAVLVANEGEPAPGYSIDPEGSISVIDVRNGFDAPSVATANFNAFDARIDELRAAGVRIYGPGATVSQDLEPEYIAVAPDGRSARVVLQEANALAALDLSDIAAPVITDIIPLGLKDHMIPGNELDPSDRDPHGNPQVRIGNWPVFGMYQPDAIAAYEFDGRTYYVTANEGDDRNDFIPGEETARIKDLELDPTVFPDAAALQADGALGRLRVTRFDGDTDGDGAFEKLVAPGARSFSIWSEDGTQVFDSGSDFERITAQRYPDNFNASNDSNDPESRSDDKGPEPEGVALGQLHGRTFAFIGLERIGGIMVYDITNPPNATFVRYVNPRDFSKDPESESALVGDLGPEGLAFIPAKDSPNGEPLLVVGNEVSGTTTIFQISVVDL